MNFNPLWVQSTVLRAALYIVFIGYPFLFGQADLLQPFSSPYSGLWAFLLVIAAVAGLLASVTLSYFLAYLAMGVMMASAFLFNSSLVLFGLQTAVAVLFAEGISALKPYQAAMRHLKSGEHETVTVNLRKCFTRFLGKYALAAAALTFLSLAYTILPDLLTTPSDLPAVGFYVSVALTAIVLGTLYAGRKQ